MSALHPPSAPVLSLIIICMPPHKTSKIPLREEGFVSALLSNLRVPQSLQCSYYIFLLLRGLLNKATVVGTCVNSGIFFFLWALSEAFAVLNITVLILTCELDPTRPLNRDVKKILERYP